MRSKIWIIYNLSAAYAILFLFLTSFFEAQAAVRINEIVASNSKSLTDQNGNAEDWIELFNNSDETVDLGGCYLTDKKTSPTQWQFPSPTLLEPYSFLIVFADSSTELPVSGSELHANFNLSKSGEYLGLIDRDGQTPIHEINFPAQYNDISYGIEQSKVNLIDNQSQFKWSIPSSSGYSVSGTGTGNVGFTANDSQQNNFNISYYEFNTAVNNLDEAENYITNPSTWKNSSYPYITQSSTINYSASNPGHFDSDNPFPTHSNTSQDKDNFVVIAETSILIPFAGLWTFGVSSDDGFSLDISGQGAHFSTEYTSARSMSDTFACFNFPTPGSYSLRLLFFEASGGSGLELFAARGNYAEFNNEMALGKVVIARDASNLLGVLRGIRRDMSRQIAKTEGYIRENQKNTFDFGADDVFYFSQGKFYAYAQILKALGIDFKDVLVKYDIYQQWTTMIRSLDEASDLNPSMVRNAKINSSWAPNHLLAINYFAARAINRLDNIIARLRQSEVEVK